jgi:hypothetical protein
LTVSDGRTSAASPPSSEANLRFDSTTKFCRSLAHPALLARWFEALARASDIVTPTVTTFRLQIEPQLNARNRGSDNLHHFSLSVQELVLALPSASTLRARRVLRFFAGPSSSKSTYSDQVHRPPLTR